jgi:hypothetical protein
MEGFATSMEGEFEDSNIPDSCDERVATCQNAVVGKDFDVKVPELIISQLYSSMCNF